MAADGQGSTRIRTWRRSSTCNPVGNCVDVSRVHGSTVVRDSKNAAELPGFDEEPWAAFLRRCRVAY